MTDVVDNNPAETLEMDDTKDWVVVKMRLKDGTVKVITFEPDRALDAAEALAQHSYRAKYGKPSPLVNTLRDEVLLRKRRVLINRGKLVIGSMLTDGKSNDDIINVLVDIVLAEVT